MTRWSLFLQTLSLLHHFLGLYCALTVTVKATLVFGHFLNRQQHGLAVAAV